MSTYASEAALVRVWLDATWTTRRLGRESGGALEWDAPGWSISSQPRGFGDVDADVSS